MKKVMFVSFSGPDGVGKTSAINLFHKITNYEYVTYDRDIPDQICYAKLAHRKINNDLVNYMYNNKNQLYVILNANAEIIKQRMKQRNDSAVPEGTTLEDAIEYFLTWKNTFYDNVLYIDNSNLNIEQVIKKILEKL